jgi:hypothetical protein
MAVALTGRQCFNIPPSGTRVTPPTRSEEAWCNRDDGVQGDDATLSFNLGEGAICRDLERAYETALSEYISRLFLGVVLYMSGCCGSEKCRYGAHEVRARRAKTCVHFRQHVSCTPARAEHVHELETLVAPHPSASHSGVDSNSRCLAALAADSDDLIRPTQRVHKGSPLESPLMEDAGWDRWRMGECAWLELNSR